MGIPQQDTTASTSEPSAPASEPTTTTSAPQQRSPSPSDLPPAALDLAAKLFDLARTGATPALTQYLDAKIPPNLTNHAGDTLLMLAAYHGHADTVSLLIARDADVDALNGKGQTPLAGAVFKDHVAVVEKLVREGRADVKLGRPSAVECAGMFRREECARIMGVELEVGGGEGGVAGARDATMRALAGEYAPRAE